ncbi:MAG: hypothetical protein OD918_05815 [Gammaproteobacteria bacterium]
MKAKLNQKHQALQEVISALNPLDDQERLSIIESALAFYALGTVLPKKSMPDLPADQPGRMPVFSDHEDLDPKTFLSDKSPRTDVERVACLAYYLSQYRDTRYFKAVDISALNTDAAQRKFSNISFSMNNATVGGYLADAPQKNFKQLSAFGEQYVTALPDRQAASAIRASRSPHKKKKKAVARKQ